jgi:hypothetical protein
MNARDVAELRHALHREPVEKLLRRALVGAARVHGANRGGEEFEEAIGRARAGRGDGDELVHFPTASLKQVTLHENLP